MRTPNSSTSIKFAAIIFMLLIGACSNVKVETGDNFEMQELPDGSVVYLNRNSSIEYDGDFDPRRVRASGELFFSVAEGESPFIVSTELGEIKVVGTEFGVKSDHEEIEVEVEEGTVELSTEEHNNKVSHGERAHFKKGNNGIQKEKAKLQFKIWMNELKIEFKKLGREFKKGAKKVGKESKKAGKELKKELKKLN
jgi:ferric-dicitrate binding protein FerR (iron transport regulator)